MLFFINYNGKEHKVRVESKRYKLYLTFEDESEEQVDLSFFGNDCTFVRDHRVFYANVTGRLNDYTAWQSSRAFKFKVETEYKRIVSSLKGQDLESEEKVTAKMPGKMMKLLKKAGDVVEKGETLAIMEAMKMENEIQSTLSGTVESVHVTEGQNVEAGELLMSLTADE